MLRKKDNRDGMSYEDIPMKRPVGRPRKQVAPGPEPTIHSKQDKQFLKFMDDLVWEFIKSTNSADVLGFLRWLSIKPKITG